MKRLILAACLTLAPAPVLADVIELKTGQRIEGTLKQATPASVSVEVGGQTITFEGDKVRAIYFGAAPQAATAAGTTTATVRDAIRALRAVQSATGAGISYRDFGPRVQDAKIIVDQYVGSEQEPTPRPAIQSAMHYYILTGQAWGLQLQRGPSEAQYAALGRDPALMECP